MDIKNNDLEKAAKAVTSPEGFPLMEEDGDGGHVFFSNESARQKWKERRGAELARNAKRKAVQERERREEDAASSLRRIMSDERKQKGFSASHDPTGHSASVEDFALVCPVEVKACNVSRIGRAPWNQTALSGLMLSAAECGMEFRGSSHWEGGELVSSTRVRFRPSSGAERDGYSMGAFDMEPADGNGWRSVQARGVPEAIVSVLASRGAVTDVETALKAAGRAGTLLSQLDRAEDGLLQTAETLATKIYVFDRVTIPALEKELQEFQQDYLSDSPGRNPGLIQRDVERQKLFIKRATEERDQLAIYQKDAVSRLGKASRDELLAFQKRLASNPNPSLVAHMGASSYVQGEKSFADIVFRAPGYRSFK